MSDVFPAEAAVLAALKAVGAARVGNQLSVVAREPIRRGTFPKEILTLRTADGGQRRVMVKYAAGTGHDDHGHRAGVAYECTVYSELLGPLGIERPEFLGVYAGDGPGHEWMFLEFLEGARRLTKSRTEGVLERAAAWLGTFHAACEASAPGEKIRRFGEDYYVGWVHRARAAGEALGVTDDAMRAAWPWAREVVSEWLAEPDTVAHTEYYPNNILVVDGEIHPVDWESAALAPGELDLASLTDGWSGEVVDRCLDTYRNVRWAGRRPEGHQSRLIAARAYLHCRWLAREADKGRLSASNLRFQRLRELADQAHVHGRQRREGT